MNKNCTCEKCVERCRVYPGWMTPAEGLRAIKAGFAKRLMRDWWESDGSVAGRIFVLAPAVLGCEGNDAPELTTSQLLDLALGSSLYLGNCTFLNNNERCDIHSSGFKPTQCRHTFGCKPGLGSRYDKKNLMRLWDSDKGRAVIEEWRKALQIAT